MAFGTITAVRTVTGSALEIDSTGGTNPVVSIDPGYPGQTSFVEVGTIVTGNWEASPVELQWGGTSAILSASNGGMVYSDATKLQILSGTATARQIVLSGSNTAPSWSTATYPATTSVNQLLYSSSANVIGGLATANNGVLVTSSGGVPSISSTLPTATQSNITTVGTIGTGVWQGTAVGIGFGGTGATTAATALSNLGALPLAGGTMTGFLILNADPVNSLGAVTKQYADAISAGLAFKTAAFAGTTATLNAIYANGAAGVGATLTNNGSLAAFSVDGVSPAMSSRILVKNQTSTFQNGIYDLTTVGSGAVAWILTRSTDYDQTTEIVPGTAFFVNNGTANANTLWIQVDTVTAIGTDPIQFNQFGSTNVTSVTGTANRITSTGGTTPVIDISASYVGQSSITTLGTITTGVWNGTLVDLSHGGTNANLTASNGGIVYSTASAFAILGGTATAGQILRSGSSTSPTWSTATYPATTTVSQILYSSSTNVIGGITTGNNGVLITSAGGVPSISSTLPSATQLNITSLGTITTGVWNGTEIDVADGGTGSTSFTAYSVICGGTTSTNPLQNVSGVGTSGQVLTSNGAGVLPTWQTSVSGTVTAVTGTTNRITSSGGTTPVIDIAATYVGQTSLTTLGTITTGTWNGSLIALAFGGTNANLTASVGGIFYSTASAGAILAGTATAGQIIRSGSLAAPSWSTATYPATTTANQLLYSSSTNTIAGLSSANNSVLVTDGSGVPSLSTTIPIATQSNITTLGTITTGVWNGTAITVANGGTGGTSFTAYSVLCAGTSATNPFQNVSGVGTSGQVLTSNGAGSLPTWTNAGSGVVVTVSGTANRITSTGGANPVIDIDAAYVGQSSITTLGTITTGVWHGTIIDLTHGGTNANLTASNGGIVYSTASALAILAGTSTANQIILSGASTTPSWSTATYPAATTANQLLYSSSSNVIAGLASANNGVLITSGAGVPSISSTIPNATQLNITALGTITTGVWNGTAITVANGGTGNTTFTAYSVICAGTTATGTFQNVSGLGSSGQVLTSNGAGNLPTWQTGVTGVVTSVSGTSNRITSTGGTTPVIDISASYVGQTSITTLGTITSGTWTGTTIAVANGGTGATTAPTALSNLGALPLAGGTMTGFLILNADPVNSLGAVTKQYADAISQGLTFKNSCYAGTVSNLSATYSNGVIGVGATLTNNSTQVAFSVDGVSPAATSRILVKNQSSSFQNGIYTLTTVGSGATNWVLTRATDYNNTSEIQPGDAVLVDNGTVNATTLWIETATVTTIGTDPITFSQFGATNVVSVNGTANRITSTGGTTPQIDISASYVGQSSITTLGTITTGVWTGTTIAVANGGTGNTTFTAYSVICAGTTSTGAFQNVSGVGTSGQVLTSAGAAALPTWSTITTTTIVNQNSSSVTLAASSEYYINNGASLVTLTLPASAAVGDTYSIVGKSSGGWKIAQLSSQLINFNSSVTTTGVGGSLASTNQYNCITIKCITANTTFTVSSVCGSITVV